MTKSHPKIFILNENKQIDGMARPQDKNTRKRGSTASRTFLSKNAVNPLHSSSQLNRNLGMASLSIDPYLAKIFNKIKQERNLDFSQYRPKVLTRRIMNRVRITKNSSLEQYFTYLQTHTEEMDFLMEAMTINVTEFFRNAHIFKSIEQKVLPELLEKKQRLNDHSIRVWSCGCSSGEEAYSILMLLGELLGVQLRKYKLSIYGTDIDPQALAKAKKGVYEKCQFQNLSKVKKQLIDKYFYDIGNNRYWIREEWPAYVNFQYHDIIENIPLDDMDIILCRNLLIYFDKRLQDHVIKRFWNSLRDGGFLILGNVESLWGKNRNNFIVYEQNARIYKKGPRCSRHNTEGEN